MEQQGDSVDAAAEAEDEKLVPQHSQNIENLFHSADVTYQNQATSNLLNEQAENDGTYRCSFGKAKSLQGDDQHENEQPQQ